MADSDLIIDNIIYEIGKRIYPVGSIYISLNSTDPGTLFGGTWTRIYDAVLHAVADGSSSSVTVTGSNTFKLSKYQMPYYTIGFLPTVVQNYHQRWSNSGPSSVHIPESNSKHAIYGTQWDSAVGSVPTDATAVVQGNSNDGPVSNLQYGWTISSRDNWTTQQSVNRLPRRLEVYMWRRTA